MNFNYNEIETMGRDELQPGFIFVRLFDPTDFDRAWEAMRVRIKQEFNWDFINPKVWNLVGVSGGPVRQWLTRYIKTAEAWKKPYYKNDYPQWKKHFIETYGYSEFETDTYFRVFRELNEEGVIPANVYRPFTYEPTEDIPIIGKVASSAAKSAVPVALVLGTVAAGYFYLKK